MSKKSGELLMRPSGLAYTKWSEQKEARRGLQHRDTSLFIKKDLARPKYKTQNLLI
jgi:hypothetical protein